MLASKCEPAGQMSVASVAGLLPEEMKTFAQNLALERPWTCFVKVNEHSWTKDAFTKITSVSNVADVWMVLNEFARNEVLSGYVNIFFMESEMLPLAEDNRDVWKKGGCWSTILKGQNWITSMQTIVLTVLGESVFDKTVKGVCVVPVSQQHCIVKIWCTDRGVETKLADQLRDLYQTSAVPPAAPRFKGFF